MRWHEVRRRWELVREVGVSEYRERNRESIWWRLKTGRQRIDYMTIVHEWLSLVELTWMRELDRVGAIFRLAVLFVRSVAIPESACAFWGNLNVSLFLEYSNTAGENELRELKIRTQW